MTPNVKAIPLIVIGVLLNAIAQICLKKGLQAAGGMQVAVGPLFRLMLEPWVLAGLACYAVSVVVWLGALSLVQVNYAYPFLALGFIANALMARAFLGEAMTPMRWVALAGIVLGVSLQALSGGGK
jgi:multidrug transporter EmrE-like cation transporter